MTLFFALVVALQAAKYGTPYKCASKRFEIWLLVQEQLTMTFYEEEGTVPVAAENGNLYKYNDKWSNATTKVSCFLLFWVFPFFSF